MLTSSELADLTQRINGRLDEFKLGDYLPKMTLGLVRLVYDVIEEQRDEQEAAAVRESLRELVVRHQDADDKGREQWDDPMKQLWADMDEAIATPSISTSRLPDPDIARDKVANALAAGSNGNLVAILNKPRTLEEVDMLDDDDDLDDDFDDTRKPKKGMTDARRAQLDSLKRKRKMGYEQATSAGRKGNTLPTLQVVIAELKRLAMGTEVMPSIATFDAARPGNWATAGAHMQRLGLSWEGLAEAAGVEDATARATTGCVA